MKKQTTLLSVPYKMTQWTLALSTLWVMLRVALRTLYIVAIVISWSFVAIRAVALVFTMHVSPRAVLTPMGDTLHHMTGWQ
ncbi:hypothetical protein E2C01_069897 [Portunus trituberculatus]|uniref:Uncharacterized protein n=1 Tax=Portunus trituberculatus TaxID=210409 RepID=A0A5B7I241_PORTR|nr:hypothetical protein [Portunus trituberculatus]